VILRPALATAALALCTAALSAPLHRYTVTVDLALERLSISACFDGPAPSSLIAGSDAAPLYLGRHSVRGAPQAMILLSGSEMMLTGVPDRGCVDYDVQLKRAQGGAQAGGPETRRIGSDLLTAIGDWLWRPAAPVTREDIEVRFVLPPSTGVSAPWRPANTGGATFRVGDTPHDWPGVVAFGSFQRHELRVPGAVLEVVLIDAPSQAQRIQTLAWIENAARGVALAFGRFPVERLQVIVAATQRGLGPVPWAYVARGGGPGVHFFVNPERSAREFELDWTATHEMSHLFLPYLANRDLWLSEGLATYLQHVLMARAGTISQDEAWKRLYLGLRRAGQTAPGTTISQATGRLNRPGTYLRVYWGGAALMLETDLRLRALGSSLDAALEALSRCDMCARRRLAAEEVLARLDAATGTTVFAEVHRELFDRSEFPDFDGMFARLGVDVFGGEVSYSSDAQARRLREGIIAPR
jgi:hypothetical protein